MPLHNTWKPSLGEESQETGGGGGSEGGSLYPLPNQLHSVSGETEGWGSVYFEEIGPKDWLGL